MAIIPLALSAVGIESGLKVLDSENGKLRHAAISDMAYRGQEREEKAKKTLFVRCNKRAAGKKETTLQLHDLQHVSQKLSTSVQKQTDSYSIVLRSFIQKAQ